MNNISQHKHCYGCAVCSTVCPKNIIGFKLNEDGFYQPFITEETDCINCGKCIKVCPLVFPVLQTQDNIQGFATWSKDEAIRIKASSGGTGFEIARFLLKNGYKAIGVRYNAEKQKAEHFVTASIDEYIQCIGSKYIQSDPYEAFNQINRNEKYLISGTPCQIAGIRKMAQLYKMNDNIVLLDFFCHGVPTKLIWDKYIAEKEKTLGKIIYASWRNKQNGWHDSWAIGLDGANNGEAINWHAPYETLIKEKKTFYCKKRSQGDLFYKYFLGDICFNKSCYKDCQFKAYNSAADIRIGDLWGKTYADNELGITGCLAFTQKGIDVLNSCNIHLKAEPKEIVTEGQQFHRIKIPYYYDILLRLLRGNLSLSYIYKIIQLLRIGTIIKYKLHLK